MTSLMVSMTAFVAGIKERMASEKGATMVEYGIMVGLIAVVVIVAIGPLGQTILGFFEDINTALTPAAPAT